MPAAKSVKELRPLCYEHHREMRLRPGSSNLGGEGMQTMVYDCTVPDCLIRYDVSRGYFLLSQNGNRNEAEIVPRVRCLRDRVPMYLAEINPEKREFRLWTCPHCGAKHTNEDGLVDMTLRESQDHDTENTTKSQSSSSPNS